MTNFFNRLTIFFLLLLTQACSSNGFQLRKNIELTPQFSKIYLQGSRLNGDFESILKDALIEIGGDLTTQKKQAKSSINFLSFTEGRQVIAYTSDRRAREYLVFLKAEYSIDKNNQDAKDLPKHRLNLDRSYLYDPDFALGKAEEEKRVRQTLYEEATRLILLRLKYAKQ